MDVPLIRQKLAAGELPRTDFDSTRIVGGGLGDCSACETPTTPANDAVECRQGERRLLLHPDCYVMWEQARALGA